jgi:hypothetical protein
MSDTESASSILEGMPFGPAAVEKVEAPVETKEPEAKVEAKVETPEVVETKPEKTEKPRVDVAAIIDERRKRQEAERKLADALKAQPEKKPSVFEDEDAAIAARVAEGTRPLREMLYKQSMRAARATYKEGFSDAETAFMEAAEADPRLYEGLRSSDDPGEYIYNVGIQIRELSDVGGDFIKYREKVTAQSRAELDGLKQQFDAQTAQITALQAQLKELEAIPRSLNTPSLTPAKGEEADDEGIETIVRFGNKRG